MKEIKPFVWYDLDDDESHEILEVGKKYLVCQIEMDDPAPMFFSEWFGYADGWRVPGVHQWRGLDDVEIEDVTHFMIIDEPKYD